MRTGWSILMILAAVFIGCGASLSDVPSSKPVKVLVTDTSREKDWNWDGPYWTLDGNGNHVGKIRNIKLKLTESKTGQGRNIITQLTLYYEYYNGSGTWRGHQDLFADLFASNGQRLYTPHAMQEDLPRRRCWYGAFAPQPQRTVHLHDNYFDLVSTAQMSWNRVQGKQTGC